MNSWTLFMLLVLPGTTFTAVQEGTVLKETCRFITFQFHYSVLDPNQILSAKTIERPSETSLKQIKEFIAEENDCSDTKEEFHNITYKKISVGDQETLVAEVTFIVYPLDNVTGSSRRTAPIVCADSALGKTSSQQQRLQALLPLNISGTNVPVGIVFADVVSCCEKLYGLVGAEECCKPGFISLASGNCACPAGKFLDINTTNCKLCPGDTYQPNIATTECEPCPNGSKTYDILGSKNLSDCLKACSPGERFNSTLKKCTLCPKNSYQELAGQQLCVTCPNNTITTNTGAKSRNDCVQSCPSGSFYNFTSGSCETCQRNSYQPQYGQFNCILCESTRVTLKTGTKKKQDCIFLCDPGSFYDFNTSNCQPCAKNSYQNLKGKLSCVRCPNGKITVNVSSSREEDCIKNCPPGSRFNYETGNCQKCPNNSFQSEFGKTECTPCPDGQITNSSGSRTSDSCFIACDPGQFYNFTSKMCEKCNISTYQVLKGQTRCIPCEDGKITVTKGSNSTEDCIPECNAGMIYIPNFLSCELCPPDTYKPTRGQTECIKCPTGQVTYKENNTKWTDCGEECNRGEFFDKASWNCTKCPRNTTQENKGRIKCKPCPEDTITEAEGTVQETDCIGFCPSGEYYDKNAFECKLCQKSYYQPNSGTSACLKCPNEREITFDEGAKTVMACVKACPPGSYHINRTAQCASCTTDYYQDEFGKEECKRCDYNHKTLKEKSTKKEDCLQVCEIGHYHDNITRTCLECETNSYQPKPMQFNCLLCPKGTVTVGTKSTSEKDCILDCKKGFHYNKTLKACVECPVGQFQPYSGRLQCSQCPTNYTTLRSGTTQSTSCIPDCEKGSYYNLNQEKCVKCPVGEYQPSSGQARCLKCLPGQITSKSGSVNSDACYQVCKPGRYYNMTTKKCEHCPPNTYQNQSGATDCKPCPKNRTISEIEARTMRGCVASEGTAEPSEESHGTHDILVIVIPIVCTVMVLSAVMILLLLRRRQTEAREIRRMSTRSADSRAGFVAGSSSFERPKSDSVASSGSNRHHYKLEGSGLKSQVLRPYTRAVSIPEHLEIPRPDLKFSGLVLGKGNFGRVEKAHLHVDGKESVVAVKMIKGGGSFSDEKELFDELEILASLFPHPHPNIVNLIGGCTSNDGPLFVVVEYCANGNLLKYLQKNQTQSKPKAEYVNIFPKAPKPTIQYVWRLKKALEICSGMAHLAKYKIIHRDVAARNVLLDENWVAKVSDFGMARDVYVQQIYRKDTEGFLPVRWMAIESLESFIYTSQSDVWSFGILLWEIITDGRVPYNNILDHNQLLNYIKSGRIMKRPKNCPKDFYHIMVKCWEKDQSNRPSFDDLLQELQTKYEHEIKKEEALPQRIFRKFSSRRKRKKFDDDGESREGKSRIQKTLSNTSAKKIDKIEEEEIFLEEGHSPEASMKMKVLQTSSPDKTSEEDRVNKGYDMSGSLTSPTTLDVRETEKSKELERDEKTTSERDKARKVTELGDETLIQSPQEVSDTSFSKELKEIEGDTTNVDVLPMQKSDKLELEDILELPSNVTSDSRPSSEGDKIVDDSSIAEIRDSDSNSEISLAPRTRKMTESPAPLASDESDDGLSGGDDWSTQTSDPRKSTEC